MGFRGILWRNVGLPVRFGPVDGRVSAFLLALILHPRMYTLYTVIVFTVIFIFIERMGYSVPNIIRLIQAKIMGPYRPALSGRKFNRSDK